MISREELWPLTLELIEEVHGDEGQFDFSVKAKRIIEELSEYARKTELWRKNKQRREKFWKECQNAGAEQVYCYFLDRIAFAPTTLHRDGCILLLIPKLDELLNGAEQ
jgi:hypothetical protein